MRRVCGGGLWRGAGEAEIAKWPSHSLANARDVKFGASPPLHPHSAAQQPSALILNFWSELHSHIRNGTICNRHHLLKDQHSLRQLLAASTLYRMTLLTQAKS